MISQGKEALRGDFILGKIHGERQREEIKLSQMKAMCADAQNVCMSLDMVQRKSAKFTFFCKVPTK